MTEWAEQEEPVELVRAAIRAAFLDVAFSGPITSVDGRLDEELDEEQGLYEALRGQRWPEVPVAFIEGNPDGIVLLTDAAFAAFLPAWMDCALTHGFVRSFMVSTFSPEVHRFPGWSKRMERRIGCLNAPQKAALLASLAHCLDVETSELAKKDGQSAIAYVSRFVDKSILN